MFTPAQLEHMRRSAEARQTNQRNGLGESWDSQFVKYEGWGEVTERVKQLGVLRRIRVAVSGKVEMLDFITLK